MVREYFDVIIIGGSYAGLAAGMALGRAMKKVLIIDSGLPCNQQTPYSHNFLTQDGKPPSAISLLAKEQLLQYDTVNIHPGLAVKATRINDGFEVETKQDDLFRTKKLIFATGIRDLMHPIEGFSQCWGISVLHCPYCHGYEVRNKRTGVLGNGEYGYELAMLISNWTQNLTLYTNGTSTLSIEQVAKFTKHHISVVEDKIIGLDHLGGYLQTINFKNGSKEPIEVLYARNSFVQHCDIPESLGCELTEDGYIKVDQQQRTSVQGVYACGDNVTRIRTVANAVAMGTTAGMMLNKEIVFEEF